MRVYWNYSALPEVQHLEPAQRAVVVRAAIQQVRGRQRWRRWLWPAGFGVGNAIVGIIVEHQVRVLIAHRWLALAIQFIMTGEIVFVVVLVYTQFGVRPVRQYLRARLLEEYRGRRLPVCVECGYNLTGSASATCPECGATIPDTGPAEPPAPAPVEPRVRIHQ